MHTVVRTYSGKGAAELFDLLEKRKADVEREMRAVKGFVRKLAAPRFIGLDNYRAPFADPIFRETLLNTFVYIAGSTILTTVR